MRTISKSKRQLAQLLIEAGVTQFPEDANWAAQDKAWGSHVNSVLFYRGDSKPHMTKGNSSWTPRADDCWWMYNIQPVQLPTLIPNWYQTVLSRDEFDQIVAETVVPARPEWRDGETVFVSSGEPDSDGWVEWEGKPVSPVTHGVLVDVKLKNGTVEMRQSIKYDDTWGRTGGGLDIIAYRLHKPEQAESKYCESVTRSIPEPTTTPTLDQLLQDWRNADEAAQRKQTEADEAAAMRDERWQAVQARAGEMGATVGRCESVVTGDVQSVKIGDEIIATRVVNVERLEGRKGKVLEIDSTAHHGPLLVKFPDDGTYWVKEWQLDRP